MSRSKKTKFSTSSSSHQTDFRAFLKNPSLEDDYHRLSQLEIIPGRFVNYSNFTKYDISSYLHETGLHDMFSFEYQDKVIIPYCPISFILILTMKIMMTLLCCLL